MTMLKKNQVTSVYAVHVQTEYHNALFIYFWILATEHWVNSVGNPTYQTLSYKSTVQTIV